MTLDLNLLTALDVLLEETSVAAAAERLHLSAPAMSRTLARIRKATGDEILVRTGRTMTRTPHALAIQAQVHELVQQAHQVLAPDQHLDLAALDRVFTITSHDTITTAIAAGLLSDIHRQAPLVRIRVLAEPSTDTLALRRGEIDLELSGAAPTSPEIRSDTIGHDDLVVAMSRDHPCAAGPLTLDRYTDALHVTVSRRGRLRDPIDAALAQLGTARRILAAVPHTDAALAVAAAGLALVTVPRLGCRTRIGALGLRTGPIPITTDPVPIVMAWHQRHQNDLAHTWLRERVRVVLDQVGTPSP